MLRFQLLLLSIVLSTSSYAGVGGRGGGGGSSDRDSVDSKPPIVHFRKSSSWVNANYNRTLCHEDGFYLAIVTRCAKWSQPENDVCLERAKIRMVQPVEGRIEASIPACRDL